MVLPTNISILTNAGNTIKMNSLPANAIVLSVKGYTASLPEVLYAPEPLFSWNPKRIKATLQWASSALRSHFDGFWVTEFAYYANGSIDHRIPGVHVKAYSGSYSQKKLIITGNI